MTEENKPLSIEEMETLMKQIEDGEGMRPEVEVPAKAKSIKDAADLKRSNPLTLKEFVDAETLMKDVEFDVNDLDSAVMSHAPMFVHYSNLARLARRQFERMKAAMEILESRLDHIHRERFTDEGKKITEGAVTAAVKADPRWWEAQQRLIDSRAIYELAGDSREAFMQRRDMIVQVSVDRRREREGELRVMGAKSFADDLSTARQAAIAGAKTASASVQDMLKKG